MSTQEDSSPDLESIRAAVLGDRGVFIWQKALHLAADLPEPVRYSLSVLALYMNPNGTHGRPGTPKLATARRVSEKTIQRHLEAAINAGWLVLAQRGGRSGDGSVRANSYAACIPGNLWPMLNDIIGPVWGDVLLPASDPQPDTHGRPVVMSARPQDDTAQEEPQQDIPGRPVEAASTRHLEPSTGHSITSTGHPACPPTDQFHRPDTPISQSAQDREAIRWLDGRGYGLTDPEAMQVINEARQRAAEPVRNLVPYLAEMAADGNELADIVEAVQLTRQEPGEKTGGNPEASTCTQPSVQPAAPTDISDRQAATDPLARLTREQKQDWLHAQVCNTRGCVRCAAFQTGERASA